MIDSFDGKLHEHSLNFKKIVNPFSNLDFSSPHLAQFISLFSFCELHLMVFVYLVFKLFEKGQYCLELISLQFDYQIMSLLMFIIITAIFTIF